MAWTTYSAGDIAKADEHMANWNNGRNELGEVRLFALSMTGAVTKVTLQGRGWAICDGTTPVAQGITTPTIETTPNLEDKFIRMSNDESSGGTGGSETHTHTVSKSPHSYITNGSALAYGINGVTGNATGRITSDIITSSTDTKPPYYELAYFMKVKVI